MPIRVIVGDMTERLKELPDNSVDSVVTDPPYHLVSIVNRFGAANAKPALSAAERRYAKTGGADRKPGTDQYGRLSKGFMGQTWDGGDVAFRPETWAEVLRVLKPGGHLVAFSGTRTYHRMAVAIEDAGFEIRDQLAWAYGSGFPKSHDISKAIDRAAGAEREKVKPRSVIGHQRNIGNRRPYMDNPDHLTSSDIPATPEAEQWQGWGTALKPAWEPICLARKPLSEKSIAANVLKWGTGALNIDGCRIEGEPWAAHTATGLASEKFFTKGEAKEIEKRPHDLGRWPANLCHDGSDEVVAGFPESQDGVAGKLSDGVGMFDMGGHDKWGGYGGSGSAARFFYCARPGQSELLLWRATSIVEQCLPEIANVADAGSMLSSQAAAFALEVVAAEAFREDKRLSVSAGPSTSVTPHELRRLCVSATMASLTIESASSLGSLHEKHIPTDGLASVAVTVEPTGITTIILDHWKSDGSADPVTFSITPTNSEHGEKVLSGARRFMYCAKAGKLDRLGSDHPTVKPVALMRWLVRMVTPPGGTVLDPFAGTGSTGIAAFVEGFDGIMVELRQEAADDITRRLDHIQGLGRATIDELANGHDEAKRLKAGGHGLPLFGSDA